MNTSEKCLLSYYRPSSQTTQGAWEFTKRFTTILQDFTNHNVIDFTFVVLRWKVASNSFQNGYLVNGHFLLTGLKSAGILNWRDFGRRAYCTDGFIADGLKSTPSSAHFRLSFPHNPIQGVKGKCMGKGQMLQPLEGKPYHFFPSSLYPPCLPPLLLLYCDHSHRR